MHVFLRFNSGVMRMSAPARLWALSRRLLKFSGGSGDDYATFSASVTSPSC